MYMLHIVLLNWRIWKIKPFQYLFRHGTHVVVRYTTPYLKVGLYSPSGFRVTRSTCRVVMAYGNVRSEYLLTFYLLSLDAMCHMLHSFIIFLRNQRQETPCLVWQWWYCLICKCVWQFACRLGISCMGDLIQYTSVIGLVQVPLKVTCLLYPIIELSFKNS